MSTGSAFFPNGIPERSGFTPSKRNRKDTSPKPLPSELPSLKNQAIKAYSWFFGPSPKMQRVLDDIKVAIHSNVPVLIIGETGSGKELVAKLVHEGFTRHFGINSSDALFVPVNCSAIPEALAESMLFGHERGAFTSARERKVGRFEAAKHGSLFLDEIQNLKLDTQAKLLRVLQNREIDVLGSKAPKKIDCRFIAASNLPLEYLVEKQLFRKDLYYRLDLCPIYLPPLRERMDELDTLIKALQEKIHVDHQIDKKEISNEALTIMKAYDWPGNIRELENAILYASLRCDHKIDGASLPPRITGQLQKYLDGGSWN